MTTQHAAAVTVPLAAAVVPVADADIPENSRGYRFPVRPGGLQLGLHLSHDLLVLEVSRVG